MTTATPTVSSSASPATAIPDPGPVQIVRTLPSKADWVSALECVMGNDYSGSPAAKAQAWAEDVALLGIVSIAPGSAIRDYQIVLRFERMTATVNPRNVLAYVKSKTSGKFVGVSEVSPA